jgi:hypothetical protein
LPVLAGDEERLRFADGNLSGCGVAHMPDGARARQAVEPRLVESIRDQAHRALRAKLRAVAGNDPARLLPAMLQGIEPQISEPRRFRVAVNPEHAAFVAEFI